MPDHTSTSNTTPTAAIVLAWLLVGIPAAWGIYNTGLNAKKLFASAPVTVAAPATPAASARTALPTASAPAIAPAH